MQITYEFEYQQDDIPVRGNAMASGDDAFDKEVEDKIIADLKQGNDYAWATVKVTARLVVAGLGHFTGCAYMGGCSYNSEAELKADCFEPGGSYGEQMRQDALGDLKIALKGKMTEGRLAEFALEKLEKGEVDE